MSWSGPYQNHGFLLGAPLIYLYLWIKWPEARCSGGRGFKLLTKMGYQAGQGLGTRATGRAEPILVDLKVSKAGLGIDEARKRRQQDADLARKKTGDQSSFCSRYIAAFVRNPNMCISSCRADPLI